MTVTETNRDNYDCTVLVCGNVKCLTERDSFKNLSSKIKKGRVAKVGMTNLSGHNYLA